MSVTLNSGELCNPTNNQAYSISITIDCDQEGKDGEITLIDPMPVFTNNHCEYQLYAKSKHGCILSNFYAISAFINANKIPFGIALIVIGLFLCFLGSKLVKITIAIIAFLSTVGLIFVLVFSIIGVNQLSNAIMWVILACTILLAAVVAYLFYKYVNVFYACLGGVTGFVIGMNIYTFFLRYIESNPDVVYWVTVVICVIIGILFAIYFRKHLLIISTSFIGSYAIIRGPSLYIGGFPSESQVTDLVKRKEFKQLSEVRYLL